MSGLQTWSSFYPVFGARPAGYEPAGRSIRQMPLDFFVDGEYANECASACRRRLRRGHRAEAGRKDMGIYLLIAAGAYLIGSVNSAILLVRTRYGQDVRERGSGNAGSTNVARNYGTGMGVLTLGCDILKAALAGLLGRSLAGESGYMFACLLCLIGHCWPLYFRFKGGKGMAVAAGTLLFLDGKLFLLIAAFFVVTFLIWRRVSLSSILSVLTFPPLYYLTARRLDAVFVIGTVMCVLIVLRHWENIRRLAAGKEPRFQFHRGER